MYEIQNLMYIGLNLYSSSFSISSLKLVSEFSGISDPALKNAGEYTKDGIHGTESASFYMVSKSKGGYFKDQLWCTIRSVAVAFVLVCVIGAIIWLTGTTMSY